MRTMTAQNIFDLPTTSTEGVCITTNGIVKYNGKGVMGAGIAKEANNRYHLDTELGQHLIVSGNVPHIFQTRGKMGCYLISFPTKYDWKYDSDLALIQRSAQLLTELVNRRQITTCYLTPPGCGCGKLNWTKQVKPILDPIFDDRFVIVFR